MILYGQNYAKWMYQLHRCLIRKNRNSVCRGVVFFLWESGHIDRELAWFGSVWNWMDVKWRSIGTIITFKQIMHDPGHWIIISYHFHNIHKETTLYIICCTWSIVSIRSSINKPGWFTIGVRATGSVGTSWHLIRRYIYFIDSRACASLLII